MELIALFKKVPGEIIYDLRICQIYIELYAKISIFYSKFENPRNPVKHCHYFHLKLN